MTLIFVTVNPLFVGCDTGRIYFGYLAAEDTIEDILNEFVDLQPEDILACFAYASASMKLKDIEVPAT